jgi:PAS domain S-box-containing protein
MPSLSQNELDMAARHLAAIVDSSDDAIIAKDLRSIITSWNKGAERIYGYTAEEMIGTSIMRLIPPERQGEEDHILAKIRAGERIDHFETIRVTKDGRRLRMSITVSPIKDSNGTIVGASKIARDITERQHLLESERAARMELEKANRLKDEFLATLSHELRTPLNAILGWATIVRQSRELDEELAQALDTIERNARSQAQIIDDLLDMSRIISGKVRLDVQRVDLPAILNESLETVRTAAEAKGIRLQVVLDPLKGAVAGDPNRLQQVFWNLLTNAIKFTPKGGRVQVVLERVNSHVEVSVIDTGEGIAPEFLPHVFNRFEQADASTTRRHGGLGLGLAIVKQLVELHGGSVRAKSRGVGEGATFTVHLPLTPLHPESIDTGRFHPQSRPVAQALPAISLERVRVLVIDDEADSRNLVKRLLESVAAIVSLAGSAAEGLEALRNQPFDVLVCDIGMPEEDGYDLIRKVRAFEDRDKSEIAAVALTAYARLEDRTRAINAGFQNHLAKPVEPSELLAVVRSLARPRADRSQNRT